MAGNAAFEQMGYTDYGRHAPRPSLDTPVSKSWLFEIADRERGTIRESFTLVLPPTSIQIKEPQRVSITKTFGNAFIDDYGPDNLQITLKGMSGTAHVFPTFTTTGRSNEFADIEGTTRGLRSNSSQGYSGRDAFYQFRNAIMRYKDTAGWDKNELRVYDLADEQAYKCILLDFTLDRNSDMPLRYPFTISLFVYRRAERSSVRLQAIKLSKDPISALNDADSLLDKLRELYQDVTAIVNGVAQLKAKVLELRTRYNRFLAQVTTVITSPLDVVKNFIDIAFSLLGLLYDTYRAGKYTLERYMNASEMVRAALNEGLKIYGYQISDGWRASRTLTIDGDRGVAVSATGVSSNARSVDLRTYSFSGLSVYTVLGEDTLQSIAQSELGDATLWPYIAAVNSEIDNNDDLVAGDTIYIPTQVEPSDTVNKEQFIVTEDVARDPYGTDIRLDADGNLVIQENSDFALISGIFNIQQAIDLRLNTLTGSMLKATAFGLNVQIGLAGTSMAISYLKMAIRASIIQDPRIASVDNMIVNLESDTLYVSMDIRIIGLDTTLPVTVGM